MGEERGINRDQPSVQGIRALADLCHAAGVHELEASDGAWSVRLGFDYTAAASAPTPAAPVPDEGETHNRRLVPSGWVGVFHRAVEPEGTPCALEGQAVREGDVVGVIEAMELQHEQRADRDGTIVRFLVEDGTPVEYGQPLLELA